MTGHHAVHVRLADVLSISLDIKSAADSLRAYAVESPLICGFLSDANLSSDGLTLLSFGM